MVNSILQRDNGLRLWLSTVLVVLGLTITAVPAGAQATKGGVLVVPVHGTIDLGVAPYLTRVLDDAEEAGAAAVVLDISTPGGRLDAVLQMRDALLGSPVRTIAFVNREAYSAGALVALASREIYMTPGAVMGAATPIDAQTGETASPKVMSAVRKAFKATAEVRGRDPRIAEAMVDPAVEIQGLVPEGELLTLTTEEAQAWNYVNGIVENREALLDAAGLRGAPVEETSLAPAEHIVRFFTDPIAASILVSLGVLLLLVDASQGGIGIFTPVGGGLLALFFWGHSIAGLAGWEGIVLFVLGLVLIAVEVFLVPGFGVAGILGFIALLGGLFLSLTGGQITTPGEIRQALYTLSLSLILIVGGAIILMVLISEGDPFRGLILTSRVGEPDRPRGLLRRLRPSAREPNDGAALPKPSSTVEEISYLGRRGRTLTDLHPGGFAIIDGERVDVISAGDYINSGETVEVILDEGYRRVVRRVEGGAQEPITD